MTLPAVADGFYWTQESWGAALRCQALDAVAPHLFTTRQLDLASPGGYAQLATAVNAAAVVSANQVHGREVVLVDRMRATRPDADALVTISPELAVAVRAADCVPLLMADSRTGAVAAVHAGWRGTAAKVAVAAITAMQRDFGTRADHLVVAIGPSIGSCCYEVGSELVDAFAAAGHERHLIDRWFSTPRLVSGAPEGAQLRTTRGRLHLDVAGANRDQLILAGVPEDRIHLAGLCTAMNLDVVTSFRAEKELAGRIAGVIRARR